MCAPFCKATEFFFFQTPGSSCGCEMIGMWAFKKTQITQKCIKVDSKQPTWPFKVAANGKYKSRWRRSLKQTSTSRLINPASPSYHQAVSVTTGATWRQTAALGRPAGPPAVFLQAANVAPPPPPPPPPPPASPGGRGVAQRRRCVNVLAPPSGSAGSAEKPSQMF